MPKIVLKGILFLSIMALFTSCEDPDGALEDYLGDETLDHRDSPIVATYQAENRTAASGCRVTTNHAGFTGSGFIDFGGASTWIEWNNVGAPSAGDYKLIFRYAAGNTPRQSAVIVNGESKGNLAFASTGSWINWKTNTKTVALRKGNNTIRVLANTGYGGPNLDKVDLQLLGQKAIITASGENQPREGKEKAFDGRSDTKWLTFADSAWIQYEFGGGVSKAINKYSITSANDYPERDPRDWKLKGSNNGSNWTTLHTRTNQTFSARFQKKTYTFSNTNKYKMYRLEISSNLNPPAANSTQLAEIELIPGETVDQCPDDPNKTEPGECGCGVPEGSCSDCTDVMLAHEKLLAGEHICSGNRQYQFGLSTSGELAIWAGTRTVWSAGRFGSTVHLVMQGDGNLVVYNAIKPLWDSKTHGNSGATLKLENNGRVVIRLGTKILWSKGGEDPVDQCPDDPNKTEPGECGCGVPEGSCGECTNILLPGERLLAGEHICSENRKYEFGLTQQGQLAIWEGTKALWSAGTFGTSVRLVMQGDGNLVLYNSIKALWHSKTHGNGGASLKLENDGRVVIRLGNKVLWSKGDLCPDDPDKTEPGECGCGVPEADCDHQPPSQGRESYDGPWGGKHVKLRDVWKNNWSEGLSSREKYLLVSNNDCNQSSVKTRAQTNGFSVVAQEGSNDSGATLLKVQGNSKNAGLKAILDVGKITITAVTTDGTLIPEGGGGDNQHDTRRMAFGSTDNTNTGGGVYHLDINANEDGVTIWDRDHPCKNFRGGFMYLRWQ